MSVKESQNTSNSSAADKQKFLLLLGAVFLFALLLRITVYLLDPYISRDGVVYVYTISDWQRTGNVPEYAVGRSWLPLYPFMVKTISAWGASVEMTGVCLNVFFGALLPLVVFGIAFEITKKMSISFCAALLTAVHPALNSLSIEIQRDTSYLFFAGCVIWCLLAGLIRKNWILFSIAGLFTACAVLIRFESFEFLLIVFPLIFCIAAKYISLRKSTAFCCAFFLTFFVFFVSIAEGMGTGTFLRNQYVRYFTKQIKTMTSQPLKGETR